MRQMCYAVEPLGSRQVMETLLDYAPEWTDIYASAQSKVDRSGIELAIRRGLLAKALKGLHKNEYVKIHHCCEFWD
jgi:hypothetical protein